MDLEVKNMHLKHSMIIFEMSKLTFEKCFTTKIILKRYAGIFKDHSGLMFNHILSILKEHL